ncbi:hypothetical protein ABZ990_11725 [Streptomyces sp. NPDC046203]|uniref:hypothetical protein n=1 Tax=Streptomyces sp. NPDC046203 TaxID=3154602 RepID=UPI0033C407FD
MRNEKYTAVGLQHWAPDEIGSSISSLNSPLPNVGTIWVFCPPERETDTWSTVLPALGQSEAFTWKAAMRPQRGGDPDATGKKEGTIARRDIERLSLQTFPMLPYMESTFAREPLLPETAGRFISSLSARSSGFALAIGSRRTESSSWLQASAIMESHFSLHRDFSNSEELEGIRRDIVSTYVQACTTMDLLPVIPLNKHPDAGFAVFCPSRQYSSILTRISHACDVLGGKSAQDRISQFIGYGGDLSYL